MWVLLSHVHLWSLEVAHLLLLLLLVGHHLVPARSMHHLSALMVAHSLRMLLGSTAVHAKGTRVLLLLLITV